MLNHALELSKPDKINTEIFKSLASNYHASGDKEHAYVWAMVGKEYKVPIASESELALLYGFDEEKFEKLDDIAATVVKSIKEGQYRKSVVPNSLK